MIIIYVVCNFQLDETNFKPIQWSKSLFMWLEGPMIMPYNLYKVVLFDRAALIIRPGNLA